MEAVLRWRVEAHASSLSGPFGSGPFGAGPIDGFSWQSGRLFLAERA